MRRPEPPSQIRPIVDPRFSRSLEYGVSILESFSEARQTLRVSELADILELSRSTAHRYAATLVVLGYLEQDSKRGYRLTHRAAGAGMSVIDTIRQELPAARAVLEDLRKETGATVSMGVLDRRRVLYVHRLFAHGAGQYEADMGLGVGAHLPLYCTAIGKALLTSMSETEQAEALASLKLVRLGPNTKTKKAELVGELGRFRLDGVAVCDEEHAAGVRSIAKAIVSPAVSIPTAISVTIPSSAFTLEEMRAEFRAHITSAAARISA
jgi:IclR family pca regulon transcriptional regulator